MMMGIFFSRSSFCAILKGSVSSPTSTMTGAFILDSRGKRVSEVVRANHIRACARPCACVCVVADSE